ncbi:MAG: MoaD/ThiS family protein [Bdellovibrio sp.]|nr:MoaD/ThiS family protein [Bdellovibrio sp.]
MKVKVRYFAALREKVGAGEEMVETDAKNAIELFHQLNKRHSFPLDSSHLKVSINRHYQDWDYGIKADDEIVFLPPVAGG